MSTTTVVVLAVATVVVIVIAVMVGLRKRKPDARAASDRFDEEHGYPVEAPEATLSDNVREPSVFDDDPDNVPPMPRRDPGKVWTEPEPFRDRRTPMIRKDRPVGFEPEQDDIAWPRRTPDASAVVFDDTPERPEPARCDPIAHPGPGTYPASEASAPAARDDAGASTTFSSGGDSGGSGGSSGGDSGGSSSSGGCD